MSSDCELEVDCDQYEQQQQVIEDINQFNDEEFEEEVGDEEEDDENLVIHEEVVAENDVIDSNGNDLVDDNDIDDDNEDNEELDDINNDNNNEENEDNSNEDINYDNNDRDIDNNDLNCGLNEESVNKKDQELGDEKVGENEVYQWSAFTGLRVKTFTADELAQFRKPFELGWKREVVLRGTVTSSGKKIGDVYYFSPDKKTKLRSYVEMGLFLKRNSSSGLQPENFTFARQPIFRPPAEIVRHAMQRGGGQHQLQPSQIIDSSPFTPAKAIDTTAERSARNSTASESEEQFSMSIAEGRAKRKRVAPTRFEDEDYSESSPFKKKTKDKSGGIGGNGSQPSPLVGKPSMSTNKQIPLQPKTQMSLQEKRRQLQHQLLQQVHEQSMKRQQQDRQQQQTNSSQVAANGETMTNNNNNGINNTTDESIAITKIDANGKQVIMPLNARKSILSSTNQKPKTETEDLKQSVVNNDISDKSEPDVMGHEPQSGAPCSMHCPGRRGMLPNLMCSRCFCLYHLDCVPGGVFLKEPRVFVCPNCLKPEDTQESKQETKLNSQTITTNGIDGSGLSQQDLDLTSKSLLVSSAPIIIQQPIVKTRTTFAPILPKPPQLQQQQLYQQQQLFHKKKFVPSLPAQPASGFPSIGMNVKLPAGTHLYRVATGPNGHSMIVKNKAFKPKLMKNARKSIASTMGSLMTSTPSHPLPYYKPAPIAPIGPIKITPKQFHRHLQAILHPTLDPTLDLTLDPSRKRRGYREYMEKRKAAVQSLVSPYLCLNKVLSYLSVADLVRLKQVSRVWHQLASQPFLWREIKLKGVTINSWEYLARNIIEMNSSTDLDFDGIKHSAQNSNELCELWHNFSSLVDYIKSVKKLKFGSIPTFVLEEIVMAAVTENPYNSFSNLELISVKNLFEEKSDVKECRLTFLDQFYELTQLKTLQLNCKNGFIADSSTIELLSNVFSKMKSLQSLVLTSLKDFTSEQFVFLKSLKSLKHLEIGSCVNWFQSETDSESETQKQDNDLELNGDKNILKGAFKYLSELSGLESLRLIDITIDDSSSYLPIMLESLITLESLTIDNLKIEPSGMDVLDHLCVVLKSLPLQLMSISTDDSHTNKCVFDLLKKLDNCSKLLWKVGALVEDSGECFVPFKKDEDNPEDADVENENGDEMSADCDQVKYMDLTFLNEIIQSELANTIIEIIPQ